MILIPVSQTFAMIDDEDFEKVSQFKWYKLTSKRSSYAQIAGGKITMHRLIMGVSGTNAIIDHIDHNGLNNTRSNLRITDMTGNACNRRKSKGNTSLYKGVCSFRNKWRAQITINGEAIHLGVFDTQEEAALAYDAAAKEHFGEYALINFNIFYKI